MQKNCINRDSITAVAELAELRSDGSTHGVGDGVDVHRPLVRDVEEDVVRLEGLPASLLEPAGRGRGRQRGGREKNRGGVGGKQGEDGKERGSAVHVVGDEQQLRWPEKSIHPTLTHLIPHE